MSSNIKAERICQFCTSVFIAKTTVTKYCSHTCASRASKKRLKDQKIETSNAEITKLKTKPLGNLIGKEFLSVKEVALLLGASSKTIYRILERDKINFHKLSERKTLIRRSDIDALFEKPEPAYEIVIRPVEKKKVALKVEDCYSIGEIQQKFNISNGALYNLLKKMGIDKFSEGKFTYVAKKDIEALF